MSLFSNIPSACEIILFRSRHTDNLDFEFQLRYEICLFTKMSRRSPDFTKTATRWGPFPRLELLEHILPTLLTTETVHLTPYTPS
jgi:hypothetical protein